MSHDQDLCIAQGYVVDCMFLDFHMCVSQYVNTNQLIKCDCKSSKLRPKSIWLQVSGADAVSSLLLHLS